LFLEIDATTTYGSINEYKGVFKLKMNEDFDNITGRALDSLSIDKGKSSGLKYNEKILYAYDKGF
jgi:hypothetical protein